MQRILIIAQGVTAKHLIGRIFTNFSNENRYDIVHTSDDIIPQKTALSASFFKFDPTSYSKLAKLLFNNYFQVIICMNNHEDATETYKNIRLINRQVRIVLMGRWEKIFNEDNNLIFINSEEILANRLFDYLPNVPVVAQNVGLGEGEIMEVLVPFGSTYVYRHIGSIKKKQWQIVALYRKHKLIRATPSEMIQPNDLLLLVGEPDVLKSVFRAIKRQLGQFPAPFGSKLYLLVDMQPDDMAYNLNLVHSALYLSGKLGKKLIVRVVNATDIKLLHAIKNVQASHVSVFVNYENRSVESMIKEDVEHFDAGAVLVSRKMFYDRSIRRALYDAAIPTLKIADKSIEDIEDVVSILSQNQNLEKISTTIFDMASQLEVNIQLYDLNSDKQEAKEDTKEHFENLSTIFSKEIHHILSPKNPIRSLKKRENFLHCLPFEQHMLQPRIFNLLSTDAEELYYKLDAYHQLFIPH